MSVLVDVEGDSPEIEVAAGPSSSMMTPSGMQLLTGHNSYIASMAKLCKESECFTDVRIVCADGDIRAHRFDPIYLQFCAISKNVSLFPCPLLVYFIMRQSKCSKYNTAMIVCARIVCFIG